MSQELITTAAEKGLLAIAGGVDDFAAAATELEANISSGLFKFSGNTGEFEFKGQSLAHGTQIAVNCMEMRKGWICWKDKKIMERHSARILGREALPAKADLTDHGPYKGQDGWRSEVYLPVRFLDTGEQAMMSLSSKGGVNALMRLGTEWMAKARLNVDVKTGAPKVCIVEIGAQSFEPKDSPGLKWAPTFKILEWVAADELSEVLSGYETESDVEEVQESKVEKPTTPAAAPPKATKPAFKLGNRA